MRQTWFITGSSRGLGLTLAKRRNVPDHLPLGVNAVEGSIRLDEQLLAEDQRWREVSRSADFSEPYPVELPADTPK